MTTTALTDRYRREQFSLRAQTLRDLARLWPLLDVNRLDVTYPGFVDAVSALVHAKRTDSANLSGLYLQAAKAASGAGFALDVVLAQPVPNVQLETAVRVTSVITVKQAQARGVDLNLASRNAFVRTAGSVTRLVLDAGRETVQETVRRDPRAGWQRVTSASACDFCLMLAGRGAVYSDQTSRFASHDACGCSAEPVFR